MCSFQERAHFPWRSGSEPTYPEQPDLVLVNVHLPRESAEVPAVRVGTLQVSLGFRKCSCGDVCEFCEDLSSKIHLEKDGSLQRMCIRDFMRRKLKEPRCSGFSSGSLKPALRLSFPSSRQPVLCLLTADRRGPCSALKYWARCVQVRRSAASSRV